MATGFKHFFLSVDFLETPHRLLDSLEDLDAFLVTVKSPSLANDQTSRGDLRGKTRRRAPVFQITARVNLCW